MPDRVLVERWLAKVEPQEPHPEQLRLNGGRRYLWRAVDHEGEVLEAVVTQRRDKPGALKLLKKLTKRYGRPAEIVTDGLSS